MLYRGRFAPSPTGALHFGSLVAAMASFCDARHHQGQWLLRMEDVDQTRSRLDAAHHIINTLLRYGFQWDEPILYQSQQTAYYLALRQQLIDNHHIYPCVCSRQTLKALKKGVTGEPIYTGSCRHQKNISPNEPCAWRVKVKDCAIAFHDRIAGFTSQNLLRDCGDFVAQRRDGFFAYHLAVVADDAAQHITHIVRGADLIDNTPRHLWLNTLLGFPHAIYAHVPLALNTDGEKLSKQTKAIPLPEEPLPTLLKAWQFLGQTPPYITFYSPSEFWAWAHQAWAIEAVSGTRK